jgi:hypothetical protein
MEATMMLRDRAAMLSGVGLGIGLMYLLDPAGGRRRRALARDKIARTINVGTDAIGTTGRDLTHRAAGTAARLRRGMRRHQVDDAVLVDRVRAQLGRVSSHPHAIDVDATDGVVTLRGPILEAEVREVLRTIERVRGVRGVLNAFEVHSEPGNVPALQGESTLPTSASDLVQRQWAPTTRLFAGTAGTTLAGYGAARRDTPGALLIATGIGLLAGAVMNLRRAS